MKREHEPNPHDVITIFPIFDWLKCEFCGHEFRREKMYQYVVYGRFFEYSCQHCSLSISHCNEQIDYLRATIVYLKSQRDQPATYRSK